jgi:hypothetical protein
VSQALDAALAYEPPAAGSGSLKRARTDGALSCGDTVVLSPGTCVALEPALGYRRSPNPAALTAAQSAQLEWIFSAVEPGALPSAWRRRACVRTHFPTRALSAPPGSQRCARRAPPSRVQARTAQSART